MTSLDREMAAILLRLELVSHGSSQAWNASGGQSGEPDDKMVAVVAGRPTFPHLLWRERYENAQTDLARATIIAGAREELKAWTHRTGPKIEGKPLSEIIIEDGEGFEAEVVARRFGVDAGFVRRIRMKAARGTEDGRKIAPDDNPTDRRSKARELRRRGLSTRQIAEILECHQTQVMRWIREAVA